MGIQVEYSPELALRDISEFNKGNRKIEECISDPLEEGKVYDFLKSGQRVYWLNNERFWSYGEMPLVRTDGTGKVSRPVASIKMLESTHFLNKEDEVYTKGKYKVIEVFDSNSSKMNFESVKRIR